MTPYTIPGKATTKTKARLWPLAISKSSVYPTQLAEDVAALVRATKGHRPLAGRLARESRIFLDADLSILGASAGEYGRYAANIALEYDWFEPEAYRKGRAGVLKRFVDRKQIFYTQKATSLLDKAARNNLQREFMRLRQVRNACHQ
jgi:predicted metal-dependent HD superfamily phosphohydrolase